MFISTFTHTILLKIFKKKRKQDLYLSAAPTRSVTLDTSQVTSSIDVKIEVVFSNKNPCEVKPEKKIKKKKKKKAFSYLGCK